MAIIFKKKANFLRKFTKIASQHSFAILALLLLPMAVILIAKGDVLPAKAAPPTYSISITNHTVSGLQFSLNGFADAEPHAGQLDQHQVQIDWGDSSVSPTSTINFVETGNKTFEGTWSNSHTYNTGGIYVIVAKIYHGQPPGNESGDAMTSITIEIPPTPQENTLTLCSDSQDNDGDQLIDLDDPDCAAFIPKLTVIKQVINDNGGTAAAADFTMNVTGTNVSESSFPGAENPGTTVTLDPGSYSVDESGPSGYTKSASGNCSATITIGETKTCTITNNDIQPTLTVTKIVVGGEAQISDFQLFVDQTQVTSGQTNGFDAGSYTVTESGPPGYTPSFNGSCNTQGQVTLELGQNKSCNITNTFEPPTPPEPATLIVVKHVVNNNGGTTQASDFTINVSGTNVSQTSFSGNEQGIPVTLDAGSYSVDETEVTGYDKSLSTDCSGTIGAGEQKTCTITNNDIQPTLTVTKIVVGGEAQISDFQLFVDQTQVTSGVATAFNAGTYVVSETSQSNYLPSFSGDCNASGSVVLVIGDNKSCTITNTYQAPPPPAPACSNGLDDDDDGKIDYPDDPGCTSTEDNNETDPVTPPPTYQCSDGIDNDEDGKTDYPDDPGCTSAEDNDETDPVTPPQCSDGIDNDEDGLIDEQDPGCENPEDNDETDPVTPPPTYQCSDGQDNDQDGKIDYPEDPGCSSSEDNNETDPITPPAPACSDGQDNDGDGLVDMQDPGCTDPNDNDETNTTVVTGGGGGGGGQLPDNINYGQHPLTQGQVLGEAIELSPSCGLYLYKYVGYGRNNDPAEVSKVQQFLNQYENNSLSVTGFFGQLTMAAVNAFQVKYWQEILAPWVPYGLATAQTPTSYVYKTTSRWINNIVCPELNLPIPPLP